MQPGHEEIWEAITWIEKQLAKIRAELDSLHEETSDLRLDLWKMDSRVDAVERGLQAVERACR